MKLSFKHRIALQYMLATAIVIAFTFGVVYFIVKGIVYENIDRDLAYEVARHMEEISVEGDSIYFLNKHEWQEREHREVQVHPVFLQLTTSTGEPTDKSPNLKMQSLVFSGPVTSGTFLNTSLNEQKVRQLQVPIHPRGSIANGYMLAAISLEPSHAVLERLRNVLLISYPIILIGLFIISQYTADRSIAPVRDITRTTKAISQNSLSKRVTLPHHQDELFELSASINNLLSRIEQAFLREKQFTSDASHELRTPLASLRGTLEVLLRKPRTREVYEQKIAFCLTEIDRMTHIVDLLLQLARVETPSTSLQKPLHSILAELIEKNVALAQSKNITFNTSYASQTTPLLPVYQTSLILENVLNNAIKYAFPSTVITVELRYVKERVICKISDQGIGIRQEDIPHIFNPFFRSDALHHKHISGSGIGMTIAYKAAQAIHAQITIDSQLEVGTTVCIIF